MEIHEVSSSWDREVLRRLVGWGVAMLVSMLFGAWSIVGLLFVIAGLWLAKTTGRPRIGDDWFSHAVAVFCMTVGVLFVLLS